MFASALGLAAVAACSRSGNQADAAHDGGGTGACPGGSVEFRFDAADRTGWLFYDSGPDCTPPGWLTILDQGGNELAIGNPDVHCCTFVNCSTCAGEVVCENAWQTPGLPVARAWDGTMFPRGTCGADAKACVTEKVCAPVGHYLAHMCAHQRDGDGGEPITCADVPFDLPARGTVAGSLSQ